MSSTPPSQERLVELRRALHRRPEPAWREFWTTARIVEELERIGVDELYVGPEAIASEHRAGLPDDEEVRRWHDRAREAGARADLLEQMAGGHTGAVAELHCGEGPTVALRVDVDGLPRAESDDPEHLPAREGFRSEHPEAMHACGHDGHATIGVGVLERIADRSRSAGSGRRDDGSGDGDDGFQGTLKLLFQPAEEVLGGGPAMAESGHLDGVDYLLALHLGLDHPTGEVVAAMDGFLAVSHMAARFHGEGSHAGARPEEGRNAVHALATAVDTLYGIPRHGDGVTRVNVGRVEGGTASNVIADGAEFEGEVRGGTTELRDYVKDRARSAVRGAAESHDCEVELSFGPEAPSAESDRALSTVVADAARGVPGVDSVVDHDDLGGSEDATFLMRHVQERGGLAAYVGVGTDHPGGHHSATFDVDEPSLSIGVDTLARTVERIARDPP